MEISFIVLSYSDANTLRPLILELDGILADISDKYEIIAIDDCSQDDSFEVLKALKSEHPNLKIFRNESNLNVGGSFLKAVEKSQFSLIGYTDGDGQYDLRDLFTFKDYVSGHDIITGNRNMRQDSFKRKIGSRVFNGLVNSFFQLDLRDVNSALKIYNGAKLKSLIPWNHGAFYDLEIMIRMKYDLNASIIEVPINHKRRLFGQSGGFSKRNLINILSNLISDEFSNYRKKNLANKLRISIITLVLRVLR